MECLITKLKGTVNDNSLVKLNELKIHKLNAETWDSYTQLVGLYFKEETDISIVGDGYFTDSTGTENKGKTLHCASSEGVDAYISNTDCYLSIPNKQILSRLMVDGTTSEFANRNEKYTNTKQIIGGLKALTYSKINSLSLMKTKGLGSLSDISITTSISRLLIKGSDIYGDLSDIKNLININSLSLNDIVTGDVSNLQLMTKMQDLQMQGTSAIYGDVCSMANKMPNLYRLSIYNSPNLTGDFGTITAPLTSVSLYNTGVTGKIEDFVRVQRSVGKTEGKVSKNTDWLSWGGLTFQDESMENKAQSFSWTGTQITYNDVTIDV